MRTLLRAALAALALALALQCAAALTAELRAQGAPGAGQTTNQACALLTDKEIDAATGLDYGEADPVEDPSFPPGRWSCLWGGASFAPGAARPQLGVMLTQLNPGVPARPLPRNPPGPGCTRETLPGVGDEAYMDTCEKSRGPIANVKVGRQYIMVQADPRRGQALATAKPVVIALAKAAAARARAQ